MEPEEAEKRRLKAASMFSRGRTQVMVARAFGVSRTTALRWHRSYLRGGAVALKKRKHTGRPRLLPLENVAELIKTKFHDGRFTTTSIADEIHHYLGVRYDPDHVCRMLHKLGMEKRDSRWRFSSAGGSQCR